MLRDVDGGASGGVQVGIAPERHHLCPSIHTHSFAVQSHRGIVGIAALLVTSCTAVLQGLSWYRARLQQDADGDVAEQFLSESTSQPTAGGKPIGQPEHSVEVSRNLCLRALQPNLT